MTKKLIFVKQLIVGVTLPKYCSGTIITWVAWVALIALYFWHLLREKSNVIIERKYHIHE